MRFNRATGVARRPRSGFARVGRLRHRSIWLAWLALAVLASIGGIAVFLPIAGSTDGQAGLGLVVVAALWLLAVAVLTGLAAAASLIVWLAHSRSERERDG